MTDELNPTAHPANEAHNQPYPDARSGNPAAQGFAPGPNTGAQQAWSQNTQTGPQMAGGPQGTGGAQGGFGAHPGGPQPHPQGNPNPSGFSDGNPRDPMAGNSGPAAGFGSRPNPGTGQARPQGGPTGPRPQAQNNADLIMNIPVEVQVVLGATTMPVATLMNLGRGAVITLDKQIGDPVDIVVNGRIVARGEVIVLEDDSSRFGVSLTEVIGK